MRRRISIRGCVRRSVRMSLVIFGEKVKRTHTRRILCRVSGLVGEKIRPARISFIGEARAELPIVLMVLKHRAPRPRGAPHPLAI